MNEQSKWNYWKLDGSSIRFFYYAYIDVSENLADQLFIKHKVKVYFEREYRRDDAIYKITFCKVKKKDQPKFLSALSELADKMVLLGYTDYVQFCESAMQEIGL